MADKEELLDLIRQYGFKLADAQIAHERAVNAKTESEQTIHRNSSDSLRNTADAIYRLIERELGK